MDGVGSEVPVEGQAVDHLTSAGEAAGLLAAVLSLLAAVVASVAVVRSELIAVDPVLAGATVVVVAEERLEAAGEATRVPALRCLV